MEDIHYPTVDYHFLKDLLDQSENVQRKIEVGTTIAYLFKGSSSISKRTIILRKPNDNQLDFDYSVALAHRSKTLGNLLIWLEKEKNWKDGGYFDVKNSKEKIE
jgi:hypothetical protein